MTLVLGLMNRDQAVLVSDRRLTVRDKPKTDESNKAAILICRDARVAVAFAGLAEAGPFRTNRWLWKALADSASPDYLVHGIVARFRECANRDIQAVRVGSPEDRRLSVVIAGYVYDADGPRAWSWLISNHEDWNASPFSVPTPTFHVRYTREKRPPEEDSHTVFIEGMDRVTDHEVTALRTLCRERKPALALVDKAVEVLRATAQRAGSRNLIGEQCTSIVVPADISRDAVGEYHTAEATHIQHGVTVIEARGGDFGVYCLADPETRHFNDLNEPARVILPKVGRNAPCPCQSGKKYKRCHGR